MQKKRVNIIEIYTYEYDRGNLTLPIKEVIEPY